MVFLSIGAVFKNEAKYLDEWLTFHSHMGVERFYLYDDESTDDFNEVLAPWIKAGIVFLDKVRGRNQGKVFLHCLWRTKLRTKWLALIDIDEFLWSPANKSVSDVLQEYSHYTGVVVRWKLFGSSGHSDPQESGSIESFTRSLPFDTDYGGVFSRRNFASGIRVTGNPLQGKSVFRPSSVFLTGIHNPTLYVGRLVNEACRVVLKSDVLVGKKGNRRVKSSFWQETPADILRINHYWSRSLRELENKVKRKFFEGSFRPGPDYDFNLSLEGHLGHEQMLNVEIDLSIQKVWEEAKKSRSGYLNKEL
jgi:hypothetical protein